MNPLSHFILRHAKVWRWSLRLAIFAAVLMVLNPTAHAAAGTNLVPNPGFETDCAGVPCNWSSDATAVISRDTTTFRNGAASLKIDTTGGGEYAKSDCFEVTAGTTYLQYMSYNTTADMSSFSDTAPRADVQYYSTNICTSGTELTNSVTSIGGETTDDCCSNLSDRKVNDGTWHHTQLLVATAPDGASSAVVFLRQDCSPGCVVNYDDVVFADLPASPSPLTLTVNTSGDGEALDPGSGVCDSDLAAGLQCTFRAAIEVANANAPALDTINFTIPGTDGNCAGGPPKVCTLTPNTPLPDVSDSTVINGQTQTGFAGKPLIELNGTNFTSGCCDIDGLWFYGGGNTVKGLVVNRFGGDGLDFDRGGGNTIQANYLGTDPSGTIAEGNGNAGLDMESPNNLVGGTTGTTPGGACTGVCNLISGNGTTGIAISGEVFDASGNTIQGNLIGTDRTGLLALGNSDDGIEIAASFNNTIGGTSPNARNVISGNGFGDCCDTGGITGAAADLTTIQGNYIGSDTTGTAVNSNTNGIILQNSEANQIGGTSAGAGNLISGNDGNGVVLTGCDLGPGDFPNSLNNVQGNLIGKQANGTDPLGNEAAGVYIGSEPDNFCSGTGTIRNFAHDNLVGGKVAGAANVIAHNGFNDCDLSWICNDAGVAIGLGCCINDDSARNSVLGNSIYLNTGLGIDLCSDSLVTPDNPCGGIKPQPRHPSHKPNQKHQTKIQRLKQLKPEQLQKLAAKLQAAIEQKLGKDLATLGRMPESTQKPNAPTELCCGPNNLTDHPVLTSATSSSINSSPSVSIAGTVKDDSNTTVRLEFFATDVCNDIPYGPFGFGEGKVFLGAKSVNIPASGTGTYTVNFPVAVKEGWYVTATKTDALGNTSEFSRCVVNVSDENPNVDYNRWRGITDSNASGGTYRVSRNGSTSPDKATFQFAVSGSGMFFKWFGAQGVMFGKAHITIQKVGNGSPTYDEDKCLNNGSATPTLGLIKNYPLSVAGTYNVTLTALGVTCGTAPTDTNISLDKFQWGNVSTTNTMEDNDLGIVYNLWTGATNGVARGGTLRFNTNTATKPLVKLRFQGDQVVLLTFKGTSMGTVNVFIDGVMVDTLNLNCASCGVLKPFSKIYRGLSTDTTTPITHNIVVQKVIGSGQTAFDGFSGDIVIVSPTTATPSKPTKSVPDSEP
jgi:hypothetical protein